MNEYNSSDRVNHPQYGQGEVVIDNGETVVVRFEHGIEECAKSCLSRLQSLQEAIATSEWHNPQEAIAHSQALAIRSVNDMWGVFSLAKIKLLPHQLWVCRQVVQKLPARWLIAEDVGLGKTIEAGLILWTLLNKNAIKRVLILAPASLVEQWQERLRTMFDIRMTRYTREADTPKSDFWQTHSQVIASLPTLRKNHRNRHQRLFEAHTWDLVIVDEAHHLNADEQTGPTLGYQFINQLINEQKKVKSAVFFTGTPHRGKHYQFFSLLKLLRYDQFHPDKAINSTAEFKKQMSQLSSVMLRNNKQLVTDMRGNKLFSDVKVDSETYRYSPEEEAFYQQLTEFIFTGKAYASGLSKVNQKAVILILTCMQKLASSSVAAIRCALQKRLNKIIEKQEKLQKAKNKKAILEEFEDTENNNNLDELNRLEEEITELNLKINLMEDEKPRLEELIETANQIKRETKIDKIIEILETRFVNRQVLFFTEYKATQALVMSALIEHYGSDCVTFINGDERVENVVEENGKVNARVETKENAADKFNSGKAQFLVSTEAGGEGIDLQENCYSLIHVDLPWNPMRLHQRVGRLNRYGQKHTVEVVSLRNPDTVETRIWDKLNEKINNITESLQQVMEQPEDLLQLVLGMTSPQLFREVFSEAEQHQDNLSEWFDSKTATFGGQDSVETVKELVGSCKKFDFQQVSSLLPQVDLQELQPFFETMLNLNKRRLIHSNEGLSFITPKSWLVDPIIQERYENLHFDRNCQGKRKVNHLLGIGHHLMNQALNQALQLSSCVTQLPKLEDIIVVFQIFDRVTSTQSNVQQVIAGIKVDPDNHHNKELLKDWELLKTLNEQLEKLDKTGNPNSPSINTDQILKLLEDAKHYLTTQWHILDLPFEFPKAQTSTLLYPGKST